MTFIGLVLGLVGPVVARVLSSLGVTLLVLTGLSAGLGQLRETLSFALGAVPQAGLELAGLFGVWTAIGMWLGAITFVLTWRAASGWWTVAKV